MNIYRIWHEILYIFESINPKIIKKFDKKDAQLWIHPVYKTERNLSDVSRSFSVFP